MLNYYTSQSLINGVYKRLVTSHHGRLLRTSLWVTCPVIPARSRIHQTAGGHSHCPKCASQLSKHWLIAEVMQTGHSFITTGGEKQLRSRSSCDSVSAIQPVCRATVEPEWRLMSQSTQAWPQQGRWDRGRAHCVPCPFTSKMQQDSHATLVT